MIKTSTLGIGILSSSRQFSTTPLLRNRISNLYLKTKEQAKFIFKGIKTILEESKTAAILKQKVNFDGYILSRSEHQLIHRNSQDFRKLVPFATISILIPELIPVFVVRGSNLIPSTCITPEQLAKRREKLALQRYVLAKEIAREMEIHHAKQKELNWSEQLKLDSMNWKMLRNFSKFFGLSSWRPSFMLKNNLKKFNLLTRHAEYLQKDNQMLLESFILTDEEAGDALEERGIPQNIKEDRHEFLLQMLEEAKIFDTSGALLAYSIFKVHQENPEKHK